MYKHRVSPAKVTEWDLISKSKTNNKKNTFLSSDIEVEIHLWHIAGCSFAPSVRWQNRQLSNCYQIHEDNDPILFIPAKHKPKHSTRESKGFLVWETHELPDSQLNRSYLYNPCPIVSSVLQVLSPGQFLTHPWVPPNVKSCYRLMSYSSYATHVPHSRSYGAQQSSAAQQVMCLSAAHVSHSSAVLYSSAYNAQQQKCLHGRSFLLIYLFEIHWNENSRRHSEKESGFRVPVVAVSPVQSWCCNNTLENIISQ